MSAADLSGAAVAFVIAVAGTRAIELVARRMALCDRVRDRGIHTRPTPRLGGAAILAGTIGGGIVGSAVIDARVVVLVAGAAALLAVGIVDDVRSLPILPRSVVQLAVVVGTAVAWQPTIALTLAPVNIQLEGGAAVALTALWLFALINVFNFMDGIDGMVAGVTAAAIPALLIIAGSAAHAPVLIALGAASIGFLVWNYHPASIFMGDGGSYVLGYLIGSSPFLAADVGVPLVPAAIALAPFLIDTGATLIRRILAGADLMSPHREHLYQMMVARGYGQRTVAAGFMVATVVAGWAAVSYLHGGATIQLVVGIGCIAAIVVHVSAARASA